MKLKKLEVAAFGGINPNSPVVIDFTQSKFVTVGGDMGTNKTSLLNALLVACGQLSKDNKNFINLQSGKIDINFDFTGRDGYAYNVRCTKSTFILSYEGEAVPEPITKMKELLGVVGVSPMEIKGSPLKEIVKWLAGYSNKSAEDFERQMDKHKGNIKAAREARAAANKQLKALEEFLTNSYLYQNWEASEKKHARAVDVKSLSAKLDVAGKNSDRLLQAESKIKQLQERKTFIDDQIEKLMAEAEGINKSIVNGNKFIEENKGAKKEYDVIKKEYDNAAAAAVEFDRWQDVKRKKKERDEFESLSQAADSQEKAIIQKVKELQTEILPDIKGVELITEDTHEDGGVMKKEGLYLDGKNVSQLSESEWWTLVMQIWRKYKVKVVVVDNMQSLGSKGVEWLQKLANDGAYILAAEMNREQKTLQINY